MDGVTILNTIHEYAGLISPIWAAMFWILSLFILIVAAIKLENIYTVTGIGCVIVGFICLACAIIPSDRIISTSYEVIISDDVNFNEFYEKYEVVEQNGKIYTIKERE